MYSHLAPEFHVMLADPPYARIQHIQKDRWVNYPAAIDVYKAMIRLFAQSGQRRPIGMLIVGATNNGKTMIIERFLRKHPKTDDPSNDSANMPCLYVVAPPKPDLGAFYNIILRELGAVFKPSEPSSWKEIQVENLMKRAKIKMLCVDEFQHIGNGGHAHTTQFLNGLKNLTTKLKIPLVCAGTQSALNVVRSDPQIENRIHPYPLPHWKTGEALKRYLMTMEKYLPLKKPSHLASDHLMHQVLAMCDGDKSTASYGATIGEITTLIRYAAIEAINSGKEQIDESVLSKAGYKSPSKRREAAERSL